MHHPTRKKKYSNSNNSKKAKNKNSEEDSGFIILLLLTENLVSLCLFKAASSSRFTLREHARTVNSSLSDRSGQICGINMSSQKRSKIVTSELRSLLGFSLFVCVSKAIYIRCISSPCTLLIAMKILQEMCIHRRKRYGANLTHYFFVY